MSGEEARTIMDRCCSHALFLSLFSFLFFFFFLFFFLRFVFLPFFIITLRFLLFISRLE